MSHGLQADLLICRSEQKLSKADCSKIALFTNVEAECVFTLPDVDSIHSIPVMMHSQGLDKQITIKFKLKCGKPYMSLTKKV